MTHLESTACGWKNQQGLEVSVQVDENTSQVAPEFRTESGLS